jgi:hypothetical protein
MCFALPRPSKCLRDSLPGCSPIPRAVHDRLPMVYPIEYTLATSFGSPESLLAARPCLFGGQMWVVVAYSQGDRAGTWQEPRGAVSIEWVRVSPRLAVGDSSGLRL